MEKQDARITIRCTHKQKTIIERRAGKAGLSVSKYMINKSIMRHANPYKTDNEKKRIIALISMKESINNIERLKQTFLIPQELINELINIKRQQEALWESL